MSGRVITKYVLICDGCEQMRGQSGEFENATAARAAAYVDGWRFPSKRTSAGHPSSRASDVCPGCVPSWTQQVSSNGRLGKRER